MNESNMTISEHFKLTRMTISTSWILLKKLPTLNQLNSQYN
ncbi:hypothetical protein ANCCAN_24161 [Ancylostoma caninum]|uniref:Uncharacterized protein n=1 Tax=Ancylostoma caninum TaxID=29170 RepID=A0A368FGS7_ANCCA|nr:hypothetical protein ANCCAN_24161 [Ancylostoma caninum]